MLAGSGHIAGVINHPKAKKYQHWLNDTKANPADVEAWIAGAREYPGSWWDDWDKWLSKKSGAKVPARQPGRSEEHTSELQSLMRISYAVFCLKKKKNTKHNDQ